VRRSWFIVILFCLFGSSVANVLGYNQLSSLITASYSQPETSYVEVPDLVSREIIVEKLIEKPIEWPVASAHDASDDVAGHVANVSSIVPNDKYFDKQWALTKIQAPEAWQITSGNQDILIAVLDTGIDPQHEDLADKVVANVNLADSLTTDDRYGHGTHIAGIIAASANNSFGIAGMSPNCRLVNVKVADDDGRCNSSVVARGIVWAVDNGAKVINVSLTINEPTQALEDAVNYAWNQGVVVIAASGNYVGNRPMYPACYSNCIAVGATDVNDSPALGSGYNDWVDVVAPGVDIYSTLPDSKYGIESGTSMATAYVSGLAGLLFTLVTDTNGNGRLNDEVRDMIETNCNEIGTLDVSKRRVDALRAVGQALSLCPQSKLSEEPLQSGEEGVE